MIGTFGRLFVLFSLLFYDDTATVPRLAGVTRKISRFFLRRAPFHCHKKSRETGQVFSDDLRRLTAEPSPRRRTTFSTCCQQLSQQCSISAREVQHVSF